VSLLKFFSLSRPCTQFEGWTLASFRASFRHLINVPPKLSPYGVYFFVPLVQSFAEHFPFASAPSLVFFSWGAHNQFSPADSSKSVVSLLVNSPVHITNKLLILNPIFQMESLRIHTPFHFHVKTAASSFPPGFHC